MTLLFSTELFSMKIVAQNFTYNIASTAALSKSVYVKCLYHNDVMWAHG